MLKSKIYLNKFIQYLICIISIFSLSNVNALTFKSDGSVVTKEGKVLKKSFSDRFNLSFVDQSIEWPRSNSGNPAAQQATAGYFGNGMLMPGAPLLSITGISKGQDYLARIVELNGFADNKSALRYIAGLASPSFLSNNLGISEEQAIAFSSSLTTDELKGALSSPAFQNSKIDKDSLLESFEEIISSQLESQISKAVEDSVSDQLSESLEQSLQSSLEASFNSYMQDLIDAGYTILDSELTSDGWSISYQ